MTSHKVKAVEVILEALAVQPVCAIPSSGTGHKIQPRAACVGTLLPGELELAECTSSYRCHLSLSWGKLFPSFSPNRIFKVAVRIGETELGPTHTESKKFSLGVNKWDCVFLSFAVCLTASLLHRRESGFLGGL